MRMARSALLVLALWLGGEATDKSSCIDGGEDACDIPTSLGMDEASLVQVRKQEWPDWGKQISKTADFVWGTAGNAQDIAAKAADALSEAAGTALTVLGNTLNRTLAVLAAESKEMQTRVLANRASVASGIATLFGRTLNVSVVAIPVGEKYEAEANTTLGVAVTVWDAVSNTLEAAIMTLAQGLDAAGYSAIAETFNATLRDALGNASAFVASLEVVRATLAGSMAGAESGAEMLQVGHADGLYEKAMDTLMVAEGYAAAFPMDFLTAFVGLQDQLLNSTRSLLDVGAFTRVHAAFIGAQGQATAAARSLSNATSELIDAMEEGISAARPPPPVPAFAMGPRTLASPVVLALLLQLLA